MFNLNLCVWMKIMRLSVSLGKLLIYILIRQLCLPAETKGGICTLLP